ncbi:MAG: DVU0298 family protein [Peptococcaceae bacterium]
MRVDYKKIITEYIAEQNYPAIVEIGRENNARALRYVQMNIWGDYRNVQRWYAISALEALAAAYAADHDEIYRNVIRRAVWAMADESGNVPWAAPEMMTAVIKACPQQYGEFIKIMITNGLDSPMCHLGVLWSIGHLGADYLPEIEPYLKRVLKFLDKKDGELRGTAVWALKQLQYEPAFAKINTMADDTAEVWIYADGKLQQKTIGQIVNEG